jgi:hypothetical protein
VDLRPADAACAFPLCGELCSFIGHKQNQVARRHIRTHQPAANQDYPELRISIDSTWFSTTPRAATKAPRKTVDFSLFQWNLKAYGVRHLVEFSWKKFAASENPTNTAVTVLSIDAPKCPVFE